MLVAVPALLLEEPALWPLAPSVCPGATAEIRAATPAVAAAAAAMIQRRTRRMRSSAASRARRRDSPEDSATIAGILEPLPKRRVRGK